MVLSKWADFMIDICKLLENIKLNLPDKFPALILRNCYTRNPYTILMVTLLSLRSKDEKTALIAKQIFNNTTTPQELLKIPLEELETIIKPLGMYKQKAKTLHDVSKILIEKYNSMPPNTKVELLSIKGIGEKTANIVLNNAYSQGKIAVDTHVHRIANLLNIINTKDEKESSNVLNEIVPKQCRDDFNFLIVAFGQTICKVQNPKCDMCNIKKWCKNENNTTNNHI
jgi:endonuclease-3